MYLRREENEKKKWNKIKQNEDMKNERKYENITDKQRA
jgi:hypothetical protein